MYDGNLGTLLGGIIIRKSNGIAFVVNADMNEWFCQLPKYLTPSCWCHSDSASFLLYFTSKKVAVIWPKSLIWR